MGNKPVTCVPGIWKAYAKALQEESKITKASQLYMVYLQDPGEFLAFLDRHEINSKCREDAERAMKEYKDQHGERVD